MIKIHKYTFEILAAIKIRSTDCDPLLSQFYKEKVMLIKMKIIHTLKYFPANSWTPMMAKMSQKMRHTSNTLKMEGIACTNAFTTTCMEKIRSETDRFIKIWVESVQYNYLTTVLGKDAQRFWIYGTESIWQARYGRSTFSTNIHGKCAPITR